VNRLVLAAAIAAMLISTAGTTRHLGEYQDVIYYNGSWRAAGIAISTFGNPWIWTLTHS